MWNGVLDAALVLAGKVAVQKYGSCLLHCCDKTLDKSNWRRKEGFTVSCSWVVGCSQSCGGVMEAEAWAAGTIASEVRKMGVGPSYWAQHPSLCSGSAHSKMALPTSVQLTHLLPLPCPEACLLDDSEIQTRFTSHLPTVLILTPSGLFSSPLSWSSYGWAENASEPYKNQGC